MKAKLLLQATIAGIILFITGCGTPSYQRADLGFYGGRQGYLEKEIEPNVYILEVAHIGGYDYDLETLKVHWKRRANELLPNGYEGTYTVIDPINAMIEEFYCPQRFCQNYPMVSGIITAKKN